MVLLLTVGFFVGSQVNLFLHFVLQACQETKSYRKNKRWCNFSFEHHTKTQVWKGSQEA